VRDRTDTASGLPSKQDLISCLYRLDSTDPDIQVRIRPARPQYRLGDAVSFLVTSNVNGYLSLWNNGVSGDLAFLVPNQFVSSVTVRAGEPVEVPSRAMPFEVVAEPPPGWDRAKAIVTREPIPWPRDAKGNIPSETMENLEVLKKVLEKSQFGEARCEIEIKP
jgi:hypothetical protein